jgi:hypothetical protein
VVLNTSRPDSVLKKKHNAIAYHRIREACASKIVRVTHEDGASNVADILTKCLPAPKLQELVPCILWCRPKRYPKGAATGTDGR